MHSAQQGRILEILAARNCVHQGQPVVAVLVGLLLRVYRVPHFFEAVREVCHCRSEVSPPGSSTDGRLVAIVPGKNGSQTPPRG